MDEGISKPDQPNPKGNVEQVPAAIERQHETVHGPSAQHKCCHKHKNWPQRVEAVCAVLLVFITGFYACYAKSQRDAMLKQNQASIDTMRIDQRPWITHTGFEPSFQPNQQLTARLPLINVGKSPALIPNANG